MSKRTTNDLPCDRKGMASPLFWFGLVVWAVASIGGFLWLLSYSVTPGSAGEMEPTWPRDSRIVPDSARANLVLLVHPHCPCSRASIAELSEIMTRCDGLIAAHVLFLKPGDMPAGWEVTDLWHRAASIPGVQVLADEEGREARLFGATTSGHAALYDTKGRLAFRGGITIARGHVGDNDGRRAIIGQLNDVVDGPSDRAVYGCPLFIGRSATATSNAAITRTADRLVPEDSPRCEECPLLGPAPDPDGGGSP